MRIITAAALALTLVGCATAYQPEGFSGGFREVQLDKNVFRVSFEGNGYTHRDDAEEMALLRSAELALKNGFTHFVIISGRTSEARGSFTTPTQSVTTVNANAYGNTISGTARTNTYGGQTIQFSKPGTTNTIMCFNGKPDVAGLVYDASFLMQSLGKKYGIKPS